MNPKISVVVPLYNGEKYIKRCLNSITKQSLKELEIIVVDDGSTDNSYKICQELSLNDDRIIIIQQENSGTSIARINGILASHGDYIMFADQDDRYIDKDAFEYLYNKMSINDSLTVIQYSFYKKFKHLKLKNKVLPYEGDRTDFYQNCYIDLFGSSYKKKPIVTTTVWNKIYNRDVLIDYANNNKVSLKMTEDLFLNLCVFSSNCFNSFKSIDKAFYEWRSGLGFSSRVDRDTLLKDYNVVKLKELEIIDRLSLGNRYLTICDDESIGILLVYVNNQIQEHFDRNSIINDINQFMRYEFIKNARNNYSKIIDDHTWEGFVRLSTGSSEEIYDFFLMKNNNFSIKTKVISKLKRFIKSLV